MDAPFPPIKATQFSLNSHMHLLHTFSKLKVPASHTKPSLKFTMSNITYYGLEDVHMPSEGYSIVKKSILDPNNHGYGPSIGLPDARKTLAEVFSGDNMKLQANDVFVTNNTGVALFYIMLSFCNEGDNILIPNVGFPFFLKVTKLYRVNLKIYRLRSEKDWEVDLDDLEAKIDEKSKFILIINPSNPFGSVFSKEHCLDIIAVAKKKGIAIFSDEIYYDMTYPKENFYSLGHLTDDVPVVTMSGMEKIYLTPGWSIGWLIFYDKKGILNDVKKGMGNVAQIFLHPNTFIQASLAELLKKIGPSFCKQKIMPILDKNKERLLKEFESIKGCKMIVPKGSPNIGILVDLKKFNCSDDIQFCQKLIDEENVVLFPLSGFYVDSEQREKDLIQGFRILSCAKIDYYDEFFLRFRGFVERNYKE
jgi:tyrosine aminotransferase